MMAAQRPALSLLKLTSLDNDSAQILIVLVGALRGAAAPVLELRHLGLQVPDLRQDVVL